MNHPSSKAPWNLSDTPEMHTVGAVFAALLRHPVEHLIRRWNWKSALLSSLLRGAIFFCTNLVAGWHAALAAMLAEFAYRAVTSGFYGSITEALRKVRPAWAAACTAMVLLPAMSHSVEFLVHWLRGTPKLAVSIGASVIFTALSTAFNLYAMRHGALIVGQGSRPLREDLSEIPRLLGGFLAAGPRAIARRIRSRMHFQAAQARALGRRGGNISASAAGGKG